MSTATITDRRFVIRAVIAAVVVTAIGGSPALRYGADTDWFEHPWFYPPEVLFPLVWTVLFVLMGIAVALVWSAGLELVSVRIALALFATQFALNLAWTPVFFGWQRPDLALVVILALWLGILATIVTFNRVDRRAAALLVPYLVWVSFATVLTATIAAGG